MVEQKEQPESGIEESENLSSAYEGESEAGNEISVAEYQQQPKYVPKGEPGRDSTGPLILKRKTTLTRDQLSKARQSDAKAAQEDQEHNSLLDCTLCKNIMIDPQECSKCRKGFCKKCADCYIDQLVQGDYQICCPNCGTSTFKLVEPHPLVIRQLSRLSGACENADKGCKVIVRYCDLEKHLEECDYATVKCTNFGCEKEMFQKDYAKHAEECEFRVVRCDKCGLVIKQGEEHDCIKAMAAAYTHLAEKLTHVTQKLDYELERAEKKRLSNDKGTQLVRNEIMLPGLSQIKFNAAEGWHQSLEQPVSGLPPNTRALILRFGLTDINVRRQYGSLILYQAGSPKRIDLTNFFIVGHAPLPPFGQATEIIMPWDESLDETIIVELQIAPQMPPYDSHMGYYNQILQYPHADPHHRSYHHHPPPQSIPNPHACAFVSIAGYQHKL